MIPPRNLITALLGIIPTLTQQQTNGYVNYLAILTLARSSSTYISNH